MVENAPLMTWQEVVEHPSLRDLPFKIELNGDGNIIMSPTRLEHGDYQTEIAFQLRILMPHGRTIIEGAVITRDNVKVPDVSWFEPEHWAATRKELATQKLQRFAWRLFRKETAAGNSARKRFSTLKAEPRRSGFATCSAT